MPDKRVVVVTGVSGFWGAQAAALLLAQPGVHVIGLDDFPPEGQIEGLDFIQADIRNPAIVDLFKQERVHTVCHLAFIDSLRLSENAFELNVLGTMKFLGMCAEADVRQVILRSSAMVYGAQPLNSLYLREDQPLQGSKTYGYIRDWVEIESFILGFQPRVPDMAIAMLRFGHIVGPHADTPMTRFLKEEEAFVLMGFDPLMQVIHEEDVTRAIVHAMNCRARGAFNVSAEGVVPLWKLMGLAGKVTAPVLHPLAYLSVSLLGPRYAPIDLDYLRYPCVGDVEKMRAELDFAPNYTAEQALREFASRQRVRRYMPDSMAREYDEVRLRDTIERRGRIREQQAKRESKRRKRAEPARRSARRNSAAARERVEGGNHA